MARRTGADPTASTGAPADRLDPAVLRTAGVVLLGSFTSLLDTTIVVVAVDRLAGAFGADLAAVQWVTTAYLLALSAVIPITGWASQRFGLRRLWLLSIALFAGASLLCGLAWSLPALVVFRVVQGLGGGMVMPLGQTLLAQAAGPARMGRVMALVGIPAQLSPILGPVLGGVLVDGPGWRWLFFLNVPVGVLALVLSLRVLPASAPEPGRRLDLLGAALLPPGIAALVFGLTQVGESGGRLTAPVLVPLALGVVLTAVFVVHSLRRESVLDLRLFARRAFTAPTVVMFFFGFCYFGPMLLLPLYFQQVHGRDALEAGLLLAPQGVGALAAVLLAGRFTDRLGPRPLIIGGLVVTLLGTIAYTQVDAHTGELLLGASLVVRGLGIGTAVIPIMAAAYLGLDRAAIPNATSVVNVVQRVGGSFGTAVLVVVLQGRLAGATGAEGTAAAFGHAFWWTVAFGVLALVPAFFIPGRQK
ncbi:DHA2 family efflux MFS transporter permease subunit [Saccharothrix syringae]|uniref:DHA2 family efflux MFS transporter permease subunit n=1 Tax=Saccharothrix syringae TaxID=103733 RepID=A0A5Q0H033_SACSY|nr:DHA2 family efflux MFS transporter permease subunit [Saccharothrix syringae]QFZ19611.1 DHA2 family efflux MFS transporter permease subunit [Saccharothrix syringae]